MADNRDFTENKRDVEIDLGEDIAQGRYANLAIISHSPTEFILDFCAMLPGMPKPKVNNRTILTPEHAKRLMISLQDNIIKYEKNFGEIPLHSGTKQQQDIISNIRGASKLGEA